MGARSDNTNRKGHRSQSLNRLFNGHAANFFNSQLNAGRIGPQPVAYTSTGGDSTIEIGGYKYHVFLGTVGGGNPQPFVIGGAEPAPVEFILIGGGGGGGWDVGGGGGAGGVVHGVDKDFGVGSYTIVVGEGGAGTSSPNSAGTTGADSTIAGHSDGTITAQGGGGGGGWSPNPAVAIGKDGGSGGGGGGYTNPEDGGEGTQQTQNPGYPDILQYGSDGGGPNPPGGPTTYGGGGGGSGGAGGDGTKGTAQPFTNFPGPGLAPAIPAPLSPTWAPFVGASGYFGYGGEGHTDTGPDAPVSYPDCTGAGADGGGNPNAGNTGSTGICIIRVPKP